MKRILFLFVITAMISCGGGEAMKHFAVNIVLSEPIQGLKEGDILPSYLTKFIQPIECEKTAFIPDVSIIRMDLKDTMVITVDSKWQNKLKKSFGTYDYDALQDDYSEYVPKLIATNYLTKAGTINDFSDKISTPSDALVFNLNDANKNSEDSIVTSLSDILCKSNSMKRVFVLINLKGGSPPPPPPGTKQPVLDALLRIGVADIPYEDRLKNVDDAMNRIFAKDFHVDSYINEIKGSPITFEKGHGRKYLEELASDRSLTGFKIENITTNTTDSRVNYIEVIEIHN